MRVLLIAPAMGYNNTPQPLLSFSDFPAGLGYIAAALKKGGHTVIGLNPNNSNQYDKTYYMLVNLLSEAIQNHKPNLIGIGGLWIDYHFIKDAIRLCRQLVPDVPVVMGGGIINNDAEFIFNLLKPDYAIVGDGEEVLTRLADILEAKNTTHFHLPNLWYWKEGKTVFTGTDYKYGNIDNRPFPDYEPFGIQEMVDKYSVATRVLYRYTRTDPRPFTIVTARGCPFNCTFCVHRGGPKYRVRSIPNIMEEIKVGYEKYQFNILLILDELFAVNKKRMSDFCNALLENKEKYGWDFDWSFQTHANAALDLDTLKLAKKAGCYFFSYGLESASPTVLASMNKRIKVSQIIEAMELAIQAEIGFSGNLIFGDMAETQKTIMESMEFYYKYCQDHNIFISLLTPYPGNKLFDTCLERGIIKDKVDYYENINSVAYNMSTLPDNIWYSWVNFFVIVERSWLNAKATDAIMVRREDTVDMITRTSGSSRYLIEAYCPHCGKRISYREVVSSVKMDYPMFLGTGCQHCNRRMKINFALPVGEEVLV